MRPMSAEDVEVLILHNWGDARVPLQEWMRTGPGAREGIRPVAAFHRRTGEPLPISVVPMRYRNNTMSLALIRLGLLANPWE